MANERLLDEIDATTKALKAAERRLKESHHEVSMLKVSYDEALARQEKAKEYVHYLAKKLVKQKVQYYDNNHPEE